MEPLLRLLPGVAIPPPPPPVEAEVEEAMRMSSIPNVSNHFYLLNEFKNIYQTLEMILPLMWQPKKLSIPQLPSGSSAPSLPTTPFEHPDGQSDVVAI